MVFKAEKNLKKIKEFLDMVENHKIELRRYKDPNLVWSVQDGTVYYAFWDTELLDKFGIENVDGWDYEEDLLFCPDWLSEEDNEDDDDDDDDDDDFSSIKNLHFDK